MTVATPDKYEEVCDCCGHAIYSDPVTGEWLHFDENDGSEWKVCR